MYRLLHIFLGLCLLCSPRPVLAYDGTEYDKKSAVIFQYSAIEDEGDNKSSLTSDQFSAHINELISEGYNLTALPDIITAFQKQKELPPKTIAVTFDGADSSIIKIAAPLLIENKIPFTLFINPSDLKDSNKPMNWDSLRLLKATKLVSFGITPNDRMLMDQPDETIKREINNALSAARDNLDITPALFAYPEGAYNSRYVQIARSAGFDAAFGIQSGVAHAGANLFALPRFPMTAIYADLDRFTMAANALPLPVTDITNDTTVLDRPVGFTLPSELSNQIKKLKCVGAKSNKIETHLMDTRVELRIKDFKGDNIRINCMIPVESDDENPRFRWLGFMFTQAKSE